MFHVLSEVLKARAHLYQTIRTFFEKRSVLEVDTALLRATVGLEPHIEPMLIFNRGYLQTSPELAMKKLLAEGVGSIYQICHAFRDNEFGKKHRSEFTLLEWYRLDFDHHDLMTEMDELLQVILKTLPAKKISYASVFLEFVDLDPHNITLEESLECLKKLTITLSEAVWQTLRVEDCLDLIFTHKIEPHLGQDRPIFIYDYPVNQAALACIRKSDPPVAERFEVFYQGL